jgi:hypothetical protein
MSQRRRPRLLPRIGATLRTGGQDWDKTVTSSESGITSVLSNPPPSTRSGRRRPPVSVPVVSWLAKQPNFAHPGRPWTDGSPWAPCDRRTRPCCRRSSGTFRQPWGVSRGHPCLGREKCGARGSTAAKPKGRSDAPSHELVVPGALAVVGDLVLLDETAEVLADSALGRGAIGRRAVITAHDEAGDDGGEAAWVTR